MKEDQKLVTIGHFENEFEAQQAQDVLEDAGIHAVLFGATLGAAFPFSGAGKQDFIELRVFEADQEEALDILDENFAASEDAEFEEGEIEGLDEEEGPGETDE